MARQVLLDATPLASPHGLRGIGAAVRGLIDGFSQLPDAERPELMLRTAQEAPQGFGAHGVRWPGWGVYRVPDPWPAITAERRAQTLADEGRVFHATQPDLVPPGPPVVATLYDLIPARYPRAFLGGVGRAGDRWAYRRFLGRVRGADLVVVPSTATADDAVHLAGVSSERIRVVPLAVPSAPEPDGEVPSSPYVLFTGGLEPHKNAMTVLQAAAWLRSDAQIVLAGPWSARATERLRRRAIGLGADDRVVQLGFVSAARLAALRANATAALVPSWCEGFGFPVLEAMAAGVPVIAADIPALREAGGDAAIYLPPGDPRLWAETIERLASDDGLRRAKAAEGLQQVARFDWKQTARQLNEVYDEALS